MARRNSIFSLMGSIFVDTSSAENSIQKTVAKGDEAGNSLVSAFGKVGNAALTIGTAVYNAAKTAGEGLYKLVKGVADYGDTIDKQSQKLDLTRETYQELSYVFGLCGTSVDKLSGSMRVFENVLVDAKNGSEEAVAKLNAVGLTVEDINNISEDDALKLVIERLQDMEDGAERTTASVDLLGKSATDMKAVFNMTSAEMQKAIEDAHTYGMVLDDEAINNSAAFKDALLKMDKTLEGIKNRIGAELLPVFTDLLNSISDLAIGADGATEGVVSSFDNLLNLVTTTLTNIGNGILEATPTIMESVTSLLLTIINNLLDALPKIMEVAVQMVLSLANGLASAMPKLLPKVVNVVTTIAKTLVTNLPLIVKAALDLVIGLANGLVAAIPELIDVIPELVLAICTALTDMIPELIEAYITLMTSLITALPTIIGKVVEAIPKIVAALIDALTNQSSKMVLAGIDLFVNLVKNTPAIIAGITAQIPSIISAIVSSFADAGTQIAESGRQMMLNLGTAMVNYDIKGKLSDIKSKIAEVFTSIVNSASEWGSNLIQNFIDSIKSKLGISSGKSTTTGNINSGLSSSDIVEQKKQSRKLGAGVEFADYGDATTASNDIYDLLSTYLPQLANMKVVLDSGEVVGALVGQMDEALGQRADENLRGVYA